MAVNVLNGGLLFSADIDIDQLNRKLDQVEQRLQNFGRNVEQQGNSIENLATKVGQAVTAYFSIQAAKDFVLQLIEVRGQFQQLEIAYSTILGSKVEADKLFQETINLAKTTPFNLTDVAQGTKQLLAYGFSAQEVTGTLEKLGNIAAGVSAPLGDIAYLYGTLKTQGRAYAQDIRQFTNRGIPIIRELADQFHTTEQNVNALVEAGKIGFPEVEKVVNKLTSAGGIFFNLMQEQSKSLSGQVANLEDSFALMFNEIGKGNQGVLSDAIGLASKLVQNYKDVIDAVELLIAAYGAYRAALILTAIASKTVTETFTVMNGIQATTIEITRAMTVAELLDLGATTALAAAKKALAVAIAALPVIGITAAITVLVAAIMAWHDATVLMEGAQKRINDIATQSKLGILEQGQRIDDLTAIIKDHNSTQTERLSAIKKINEISPEYLGNITLESFKTDEATKAIDKYLEALDRRLIGEAAYSQKLDNQKRINELKNKGVDALTTLERSGLELKDYFSNPLSSGSDKRIVQNLIATYENANKQIDTLYKSQIKEILVGNSKAEDETIKAAILFQERLRDVSKNFGILLKTQTGKKDLEAIQKALTDALDVPKISDSQINTLKGQLSKVGDALQKYSLSYDKKQAKQGETEFDKRKKIYDQIAELNAAQAADNDTANDKEVKASEAKYKKILKNIDDYNRNAKTKIKPEVITAIQSDEQKASDAIRAKQQIDTTKITIDAQKEMFDEFEKYKVDQGSEEANRRYAADLKGFSSYVEYLKGLLTGLTGKTDPYSNALRDVLTKEIPKAQGDATKRIFQTNLSNLKRVDDATENSVSKRREAERKYTEDVNTLVNNRSKYTDDDYQKRLLKLDDNYEKELAGVKQLTQEETAAYRDAFKDITNASLSELKRRIQDAKKELGKADLSASLRKDAIAKVQNAERELNDQGFHHDDFGQLIDDYDQMAERGKKIANYAGAVQGAFSGLANSLQDINPDLADTFNTISQIAGVANSAANSFASFSSGDIVGGISSAISAIGSVFSIFGAAKKSAAEAAAKLKEYQDGLIKGQITYNQLIREQERTLQNIGALSLNQLQTQQQLLATQKEQAKADYDTLLAQLTGDASRNKSLQETIDKLKSMKIGGFLQSTIDKLTAQLTGGQYVTGEHTEKYGGFLGIGQKTRVVQETASTAGMTYDQLLELYTKGKLTDATKAWFEELKKAHDEMGDIADETQAVQDQINQIATGTTANSIAQAIIDGFKAGKRSAADFADDFTSLMQNAALSIFQSNYLNGAIEKFYQDFAAAGTDGVLSPDDVARLKAQYAAVIADAANKLEGLESVVGPIGGGAATQNSLAGSIQASLTEQTGTVIAGTLNGLRIAQLDTNKLLQPMGLSLSSMLNIGQQQLMVAINIEANTKRSADNSDMLTDVKTSLASIDKKMSANNNALAANGRV